MGGSTTKSAKVLQESAGGGGTSAGQFQFGPKFKGDGVGASNLRNGGVLGGDKTAGFCLF